MIFDDFRDFVKLDTPRRRHKLHLPDRHTPRIDVKLGLAFSPDGFLRGQSSRAQSADYSRSTSQKGFQNVKNFEFHQNPVSPHTDITLEPGYTRKALRVT